MSNAETGVVADANLGHIGRPVVRILVDRYGAATKVVQAIAQSHERFDGTGYPNGLKGEDISLFARILATVDTFYALVSMRPHRKPFLPHEAIELGARSGPVTRKK